jgi:hypothetical protein
MSVQFGIGILSASGISFGYLQEISFDFEFEEAVLHSGAELYPVDVRIHTGSIKGSAGFADIDVEAFVKLLGGTVSGSEITINSTSAPLYFQLQFTNTTDNISFIITLYRCKSGKLSLPFSRTNHLIPNFDFNAYADGNGRVAVIDCGDVS